MAGVGWGNNVHVTSRSSQVEDSWTLCSAFRGDGWGGAITFMSRPVHLKLKTPGLCGLHSGWMGGVGWGNNVHVTSRSSQVEDSWTLCSAFRGGWLGWGGAITFMSRPVHLKLKTPGLYALHSGGMTPGLYVTSRSSQVEDSWALCSAFRGGMGGVGWSNNVHVTSRSSQVEDSWALCSAFRGDGWGGVGQ